MNVNSSVDNAYIELLPEEILYRHVFLYLKAEDIFNLGQCSQKMKKIVVENTLHPLTTHLQYIQTKRRYLLGEKSVYDSSRYNFSFNNASKCNEVKCCCQHFLQSEEWMVLDPKYCESCMIIFPCQLRLECRDCCILLDELRTENWRKFDQMWR